MPLLMEQGLPTEVLALAVNKGLPYKLISNAQKILTTLLGSEEEAEAVELIHDAEWAEFPELGEAIKAAGGEELSICLALCPSRNLWGVGIAGKTKVREPAARLALAASLAHELGLDIFSELAGEWPDFAQLCHAAGQAPEGFELPPPPVSEEPAPAPAKRQRAAPSEPAFAPSRPRFSRPPASGAGEGEGAAPARSLARDVPLWLTMAEDAERPEIIDGFPDEALVVSTDGSKRKGLYSRADEALKRVLAHAGVAEEEIDAAVEYRDDANWEHFPSVGEALKRMAPAEECICVAACPALGVWAVGVGMKGRARFNAAKAALVGAVAMAAEEAGEGPVDLTEDLPSVAEFIEEVRQSRGEGGGGFAEPVEPNVDENFEEVGEEMKEEEEEFGEEAEL